MEQDITIIAARWSGFAFMTGIIIHIAGALRFPSQDWLIRHTIAASSTCRGSSLKQQTGKKARSSKCTEK